MTIVEEEHSLLIQSDGKCADFTCTSCPKHHTADRLKDGAWSGVGWGRQGVVFREGVSQALRSSLRLVRGGVGLGGEG